MMPRAARLKDEHGDRNRRLRDTLKQPAVATTLRRRMAQGPIVFDVFFEVAREPGAFRARLTESGRFYLLSTKLCSFAAFAFVIR